MWTPEHSQAVLIYPDALWSCLTIPGTHVTFYYATLIEKQLKTLTILIVMSSEDTGSVAAKGSVLN